MWIVGSFIEKSYITEDSTLNLYCNDTCSVKTRVTQSEYIEI